MHDGTPGAGLPAFRGQVEELERALEAEADGGAVLHQIAGVRGAVQGLLVEVMDGHVREHIAGPAPRSVAARDRAADELIAVLRAYLK